MHRILFLFVMAICFQVNAADLGTPVKRECIEPGGTKTETYQGVTQTFTASCWKEVLYYEIQKENNGTCKAYINDKSCTRISSQCNDLINGICYSQKEVYQCQSKSTGNGQICGGELFCKDGTCMETKEDKNNRFAEAVSALAALAAAGEDAKGDSMNVRVFTGKPQSCRKAMAGFKNCCQSGGWGEDIGLAHCSDEEKALGKAREKGITVKVGTYCGTEVLGACVQQKTGYCVFESKLSKIVQEQGRKGQLGISFGSGKSPDCRGITVDELGKLHFDNMDWSSFFDDLARQSNVPQDQQLLDRVNNSMAGFKNTADPNINTNPTTPIK
ncbi:hypothetical protein AM352_24160 (plasmid) [Citrobacter koseri]|uniref:conjugal transfer protein TraN n=2 Tax=Citrobacter TaxID=544 RepID=UPI000CE66487|nr:conjugal transfer protein TraN [Citrobacter koseri]AVE61429.1 hypothetical protein AM352_24160 [Citrobacter koseri]